MKHTTTLLLALALAASSASALAKARFEWIDNNSGLRVFSDRPPPGGPESVRGFVDHAPNLAPAREPAAAASASGVDKALEAKKREAEEAQEAQRREAERQRALQRADNCKRALQARDSLNSDLPMGRVNEKGETEILTDAQRAEERTRVRAIIEDNCN